MSEQFKHIDAMAGLQMLVIGPAPGGRQALWMPPNPVGDPRAVTTTVDFIKHPEGLETRDREQISGIVPDGKELLMRNFEENMALENGKPKDWAKLWGKEAGKTAIVVSCGPSLRRSLPEIRRLARNKDEYFTIGLNRALRAHELDYYHIADRRGDRDWTEEGRDYSNTTLLASTAVACQHPAAFKNRYWGEYFLAELPDSKLTRMSVGMCISLCDTLYIAYKLGAKKILLYGCDFALNGEIDDTNADGDVVKIDRYYHDVSAEKGLAIRSSIVTAIPPVLGINNELVFTTWELMCYAAYTSAIAYMIENSGGVPVRNRTPCGILTESWRKEITDGDDLPDAVPVRTTEDRK